MGNMETINSYKVYFTENEWVNVCQLPFFIYQLYKEGIYERLGNKISEETLNRFFIDRVMFNNSTLLPSTDEILKRYFPNGISDMSALDDTFIEKLTKEGYAKNNSLYELLEGFSRTDLQEMLQMEFSSELIKFTLKKIGQNLRLTEKSNLMMGLVHLLSDITFEDCVPLLEGEKDQIQINNTFHEICGFITDQTRKQSDPERKEIN